MTFNIIGISETKEQVGHSFLTNVSFKDNVFYSQPSNSSAGGVGLYIRTNPNHIQLQKTENIPEDESECIWVEIKNEKSKHIMRLGIQTSKH